VLDGRDIGTVIAPQAEIKLYITASKQIRAERRMKELHSKGQKVTYEAVLADLEARDARDANRATAPAKAAETAVTLDTSNMSAEEAFAEALRIVKSTMRAVHSGNP
jgi:cytidylate kinase